MERGQKKKEISSKEHIVSDKVTLLRGMDGAYRAITLLVLTR